MVNSFWWGLSPAWDSNVSVEFLSLDAKTVGDKTEQFVDLNCFVQFA